MFAKFVDVCGTTSSFQFAFSTNKRDLQFGLEFPAAGIIFFDLSWRYVRIIGEITTESDHCKTTRDKPLSWGNAISALLPSLIVRQIVFIHSQIVFVCVARNEEMPYIAN